MSQIPAGLMSVSPRGRGRPRVSERGASVSSWIPEKYHDRLIERAAEKRQSVSGFVRDVLRDELKKPQR